MRSCQANWDISLENGKVSVGGVSDADRESKGSTFGVGDASHNRRRFAQSLDANFAVLLGYVVERKGLQAQKGWPNFHAKRGFIRL